MYGLVDRMSLDNIEGIEVNNCIDDEWLEALARFSLMPYFLS